MIEPTNSPLASAQIFQAAKSVRAGLGQVRRRARSASSSQRPSASSASKYSSVAAATAAGGFRPMRCHSRQPSTAQARMPSRSASSFSGSVLSRLARRDRHGERDQVQPAPHRLVDVADGGLVVAGDDELELRHELEEVLAHEAGGDLVAAGQRLELALGPAPALLGLDRGDQARAAQARHVGRVPFAGRRHEHVHRRDGRVVAEDGRRRC